MLGKIGFWIAQPGLDAACQRQLVALRLSSRDLADVATARKRLELQVAELERQAGQPDDHRERRVHLRQPRRVSVL